MNTRNVLAAAIGTGLLSISIQANASDNDAQAAAREAIRKAMSGASEQPAAVAPKKAPAAKPAAKVQPAPAASPVTRPKVVTPPTYSERKEVQEEAREAMRKAMQGAGEQSAPAMTTAPVAHPAVKSQPAQMSKPAVQPKVAATPTYREQPEVQEEAREAVRKAMQPSGEQPQVVSAPAAASTPAMSHSSGGYQDIPPASLDPQTLQQIQKAIQTKIATMPAPTAEQPFAAAPATAPYTSAPAQTMQPARMPAPTSAIGSFQRSPWTAGMVTPEPAVSSTQRQQLNELLSQYRADQISPEEYHKRRADILAGK